MADNFQLSPDGQFALYFAFILKRMEFEREGEVLTKMLSYYNGTLELISRNICKPSYDIISGKFLLVLTTPGKKFLKTFSYTPK